MTLGCVVMASGEGRRFGGDKLMRPVGGQPMLARALSALPEELRAVVVVVRDARAAALAEALGYRALLHAEPEQRDTIRLGLTALPPTDGCLFLVADQPLLTRASVCRVLDAFSPAAIIRLAADGRPGNPVLFPRAAYPALLGLAPGQTGGAVIRSGRWPVRLIAAADPAELSDVDTRAELDAVEKIISERQE